MRQRTSRGLLHQRGILLFRACFVLALAASPQRAAVHPLSQGGGWSDVVPAPAERAPQLDSFGRWIVYLDDAEVDGLEELWSASLGGGSPIRLSGSMLPGDYVTAFEVAADGSFVAFVASLNGEPTQLYIVPIEGGTPIRKSHDLDPGAYVDRLKISPDSQWLLYTAETDENRLDMFRVEVSGGTPAAYSYTDTSICTPFVTDFEISQDSSLVAFRAAYNCSGTIHPNRLLLRAPIESTSALLMWSVHDGGFISQYAFTRPTPFEVPVLVYITDINGPPNDPPQQLQWGNTSTFGNDHIISGTIVAGGAVASFQPIPGTQKVVFLADREIDEVPELFLTTAGIGGVVQVPVQLHEVIALTWMRDLYAVSPDGGRVLFVVDDNPISGVDFERLRSASVAAPGSSTLLSDTVPGGATFLRVEASGDSSRALFLVDRDEVGRFELFSAPLAGGASARLNPTANPLLATWDVLDFATSIDGARVSFVYDSETFMSGAHQSQIRSSATSGGGSVVVGPNLNRLTSTGFAGVWAPSAQAQAVAAGDAMTPQKRELYFANDCLFCDGFEGTGDGLARWSSSSP